MPALIRPTHMQISPGSATGMARTAKLGHCAIGLKLSLTDDIYSGRNDIWFACVPQLKGTDWLVSLGRTARIGAGPRLISIRQVSV